MKHDNKDPQNEERKSVSLPTRLGWVSFFNDCSSEVIARALPLYLTSVLGVSATLVGVIEGVAESVSLLLKGITGWLSDRAASRKPFVFMGYFFSFLSRVALLAAHIPLWLGLARVCDRTGKGIRTAPRDAMVADAAALGTAGKSFGITRFLDTLGALTGIAVILGLGVGSGAMTQELFRKIVLIAIPFSLASLAVLAFFVPVVPRETKAKLKLSWHIPKKIRTYLSIVFVFSLANSSDAFLVLRASELGYSFRDILIILFFFNVLAAALAIPAGALSDKIGRIPFLAAGWIIYGVTYASMGMTSSKEFFAIALLVYGGFYGFTEGTEKALLADLLPAEERGAGYGSLQLALGIAALPASVLMGFVMTTWGSSSAFLVAASIALLAALLLCLWALTARRIPL